MNDNRVKSEAFWKIVRDDADRARDVGKTVSQICEEHGVTASGLNYASHRYGWLKSKTKKFPKAKTSKFTEFVPAGTQVQGITIERNGIKITVNDVDTLKNVLQALELK